MSFEQALRLTTILLASASFVALTLSASLPGWLMGVAAAALISMLLSNIRIASIDRLVTAPSVSTTTWNILAVGGFIGFWIDLFWISGELLSAGVHFLLILMVVKLLNLQVRRDYLHLYAISLVAILASGALTTDLWYLPIFLIYVVAGVWTLLLFQLTRNADPAHVQALPSQQGLRPPESLNRVTPQLFWLGNGLAVAAFGLTILIFFAIPRVSAGLYQKGIGENIRTSGFSETVNLGAMGPIKRDPSIVMRVELPDRIQPDAGRLYMRGVAFDRYDGKSWANRLTYRRSLTEDLAGTFVLRSPQSPGPFRAGEVIRQKILLEPLDTPVLFAAPYVERVSGKFLTVQADATGAIYLSYPSTSRIEYSVESRTTPIVPADFDSELGIYPDTFAQHFLQLPARVERIAQLARDVSRSAHTPYEKAVAIHTYLIRNFRYTLDAPLSEQELPLDEFLFVRKTGYCEHYATAMAVMLRTIGIPARLVTGFMATEWNEYGNYYLVRQQDAHAWVEVHLPHSGWIMMDPTPESNEEIRNEVSAWHALGRIMDSVRLQWNRFFVQYSAADQLTVIREMKASSHSVREKTMDSFATLLSLLGGLLARFTDSTSGKTVWAAAEFIAIFLVGLGVVMWLIMTRPWKENYWSTKAISEEQTMVRLYRSMIAHLVKKGIVPQTSTPPLELIRLTQDRWGEASEGVIIITELYCRARFGQIPLTKEELRVAQESLRHLTALARS